MIARRGLYLNPLQGLQPTDLFAVATGMQIDGSTKKIAWKFFAQDNQAITGTALFLLATGTQDASTRYKLHVETDNADTPSGTIMGSESAEFGMTATGLQTLQTFNTGGLTRNTPYWLVLYYSSGTAPTASIYMQARRSAVQVSGGKIREFNGTDWTTVSAINYDGLFVAQLTDSSYFGALLANSSQVNSARTAIYGANRWGVRWKLSVAHDIAGCLVNLAKSGTPPNALEVSIYSGDSLLETVTIPVASVINNVPTPVFFSQLRRIQANTYGYILLHQASDGGAAGNSWAGRVLTANSTYAGAFMFPGFAEMAGASGTPSALTAYLDEHVILTGPIVADPTSAFISGAGGLLTHPGMAGGMRG